VSGICGIIHTDGTPVDADVLGKMTAGMAFRGPDRQQLWQHRSAGFGHALLRTTFEAENEQQPYSLDDQVCITADARIDAQSELRAKLTAAGRSGVSKADDAQLILNAYLAWGEECVKHLIGDFAFAIWDARRQTLFCARDHFGVKPFFYSQRDKRFVFANGLDCVRIHPSIRGELDELAIANFLLFGSFEDWAATAFADIRRLPPGHTLVLSAQDLTVASYWSLPDLEVSYREAGDYVEHFSLLLDQAVSDRLRSDKVAIEMSGGLDSTSLAAVARKLMQAEGRPFELCAHSVIYDRLFADPERRYAQQAADYLGIPIHFLVADDYRLYGFHLAQGKMPEPCHAPQIAMDVHLAEAIGSTARVALTGWDGDALLAESPKPYLRTLARQRKYLSLVQGIGAYALSERRLLPLNWRDRLSRKNSAAAPLPTFPPWINREFATRLHLHERWARSQQASRLPHPLRPYALKSFGLVRELSNFFDNYDPGVNGQLVEYRHPMMDLRLISYCLSLPPLPWCVRKRILREAMRGCLPESVRLRAKTALAGNPYLAHLHSPESDWVDGFKASPWLGKFIDTAMIPARGSGPDSEAELVNLRPLTLNFWLCCLSI
jgi:asparagine synthase (glutamine-hydrolysing)